MHNTVPCKFNELWVIHMWCYIQYIIFSQWFLFIVIHINKSILHILSTIGLGLRMKPLSVLTKAPMREQILWVRLLYKSKGKLFHWAIYWGTWASFVSLKLICCCNTALTLLCYGATVMRLVTHHAALPLILLLGHLCCFSATVIILCQTRCQPVSCYVQLSCCLLPSRCHATLPVWSIN